MGGFLKIINRLIDLLYDIIEYLFLLALLALAIFVILWRFDAMYKMSFNSNDEDIKVVQEEAFESPSLSGEKVTVVIPKGTNPPGIVNILSEYGLIDYREEVLARLESLEDDQLPSGSFDLSLGLSADELLKELGL